MYHVYWLGKCLWQHTDSLWPRWAARPVRVCVRVHGMIIQRAMITVPWLTVIAVPHEEALLIDMYMYITNPRYYIFQRRDVNFKVNLSSSTLKLWKKREFKIHVHPRTWSPRVCIYIRTLWKVLWSMDFWKKNYMSCSLSLKTASVFLDFSQNSEIKIWNKSMGWCQK